MDSTRSPSRSQMPSRARESHGPAGAPEMDWSMQALELLTAAMAIIAAVLLALPR